MSVEKELAEIDRRIDKVVAAASDRYRCWQLHTVKPHDNVEGLVGCVPSIRLPVSLVGKTVKVTVEEQP